MTDNEPLIYLIGNYDTAADQPVTAQHHSPMELDQGILPPAPSVTDAYTEKDTGCHKDNTDIRPGIHLSSTLNLVVFIEQADKKRKNFYDHGNAAMEAMKYKFQRLSREFNETGKRTGHIITHSIEYGRKQASNGAAHTIQSFHSAHRSLNNRVNRALDNLEAASRNVKLGMKRNAERVKLPSVTLQKKHYAALASAGALGLTTTFVMQSANNNNTPQESNTSKPAYKVEDFLIAADIDPLEKMTSDSFILADEINALAAKPISRPSPPRPSRPEPAAPQSAAPPSPWSSHETTILEIPLADEFRVSSRYGMRFHPIKHRQIMHGGVDIAAPTGTAVEAPAAGIVKFAGRKGGYGKTVILDHGNGIETLYAHLSRIHVNKGDHVGKDDTFAKVGATGRVTGAHLHFEVRKDGKRINPSVYVAEQREVADQREKREIQTAAGLAPSGQAPKRVLR